MIPLETKLRAMAHNQSPIFLTAQKRCSKGFIVTGPDGKLHRARTRKEALENLRARMRVYRRELWAVRVTP